MRLTTFALLALGALNLIATLNLGRKVRLMDKNLDTRLNALHAAVESEQTVIQSAIALIVGFGQRLAAAIAAASGAGATEEQLADLNALTNAVSSSSDALAQAVAANTEAAPADEVPASDEPAPAETPAETTSGETGEAPAGEPETPAEEPAPDTPPASEEPAGGEASGEPAPVGDEPPADEAPADQPADEPADGEAPAPAEDTTQG